MSHYKRSIIIIVIKLSIIRGQCQFAKLFFFFFGGRGFKLQHVV